MLPRITRARPVPPEGRPGRSGRLGAHVAGLALVLVALTPVLGRDLLFSADEGAAVAQARLLGEERGWALAHPLPALDPVGQAFPLENATPVEQPSGRPASAPFAKHPAYAVLLAPFDARGGVLAMTLTSVFGTVLAAAVAGALVRRALPGWGGVAVWATGLATPLFVDSWLVIAHTLGAALAALATLSVLRAHEHRGPPAVAAAGVAMAGAVLLRNEALLFGIALALAALALAGLRRRAATAIAGLAVLAGAVGAHLLDRVLSTAVAGTADAPFTAGVAHAGFVAGRISGAVVTLVLPSYGSLGLPDALLVLTAGALVGAVVVARLRPDDVDGIRLLAALAVVAAVVRAVLSPEVAPGLLVAAPALTAGLAAIGRSTFRRDDLRLLGVTVSLFAGAVLATQYASGGTGEWGGRYFALALPLLVPLVVVALHDLLAGLSVPARRPLVGALVVVAVALAVVGGRSLRAVEDRSGRLVETIAVTARTLEDPVVVATAGAAARFAWADVLAGGDWLLVGTAELPTWLAALDEAGRDVVLATPDLEAARPALAGWASGPERRPDGGSPWSVVALRPP